MSLPLEREEIQRISEELEVIIAAHLAWFKQLNLTLVCGGPINHLDLEDDAHLRSPFGQWYYSREPYVLDAKLDFRSLGLTQQAMHGSARQALLSILDQRHLAPPCATLRHLAPPCAALRHLAPPCATLRRLQLDIIGELLTTDSLTGCASRRGMMLRLREEQERALRIQRPCCLCLLDFDRFKRVNDDFGHPAGDAVLSQGLRFVTSVLRKYDSIYRYGGEEFLICLPGTPLNEATLVVERIRAGLECLPIRLPSGATLFVTASFGVAEMNPRLPVEESIASADMAMIRAKEEGRNRVVIWTARRG